MTGGRSNTFVGLAFGQDPLDDPLVAGWDAVVGRDPGGQLDGDSDDVILLRRFLALDTVPPPSPAFFADLERQLAALPPVSGATQKGVRASKKTSFQNARPAVPAPGFRSILQPHRWTSMQRALVALSVMLVVSLLVLYRAVPGPSEQRSIPAASIPKPALETLAQFDFAPPMWDMPDATDWDYMETGLFTVAPATSFTTDAPFFSFIDGPMSFTVLSGELTITPAGPAFFYPAHQSGQPHVEVSPGETVAVGLNETIVYSAVDTVAGSNPGTEPALIMYGATGILVPTGSSQPEDVTLIYYEKIHPIPVPTKGATVTLQRLELAPFDTFVFEPDADLRYLPLIDPAQTDGLRIEEGALEGLVPQPGAQRIAGATQLRYLTPGPHTVFNLGDKTVAIYFLVVEPFPDAATPTP